MLAGLLIVRDTDQSCFVGEGQSNSLRAWQGCAELAVSGIPVVDED